MDLNLIKYSVWLQNGEGWSSVHENGATVFSAGELSFKNGFWELQWGEIFFGGIELGLIKPGIHLIGWKGLCVLDSELMGVFG